MNKPFDFEVLSVHLQLSACLADQFTCHNGKCINMESRCDNVEVEHLVYKLCPNSRAYFTK